MKFSKFFFLNTPMRKRNCLLCRDTLHSGVCDTKMQELYLLVFVTWYWLYKVYG